MGYARFGPDSDVYVFLNENGFSDCCGCALGAGAGRSFASTAELMRHLERHKAKGHQVPQSAILELQFESEKDDAWIRERAAQGRC